MKIIILATILTFAITAAAQAGELKVTVSGIENGKAISEKFAHCVVKGDNKSADGENISPAISWDKGPEGTKSYAVIVVDRDVPLKVEDAYKEGVVIAENAPRQNFYHWMLVNVPVNITTIPEGQGRDKNFGDQLVNDYLKFSGAKKTDQNIKKYSGYDGPCPPWNDLRMHNYHFKVYALSETFNTGDEYNGDEIMHKIAPYVLATGEVVGTYTLNSTLNPALAPKKEVKPDAAKAK